MNYATKRGVSELKLSKAQSPNISLKDNSNELSQVEHHNEQNNTQNSSSQCPTSLNNIFTDFVQILKLAR